MTIKIDPQFKSLIPHLSQDEFLQLEKNITEDGCREAVALWGDILLDGHNRYEICTRLQIPFKTVQIRGIDSAAAARIWMRSNQKGRRNLSDAWLIELELGNKADLLEIGRAKQAQTLKQNAAPVLPVTGKTDSDQPAHNTRQEIAKAVGVSSSKVSQAEVVRKKDPELWERTKAGETTLNAAYLEVQRAEKIEVREQKITELKQREVRPSTGLYDVVVIDPPWPMIKIERAVRPNQIGLDYPTMTEEEIKAIQLPMADSAHVWVWTTQKYLPMALRCLEAWGLNYICTFVWHKPGGIQPFGLPQYNAEFALYARKGAPIFIDTKAFNVCFNAPRGAHSEKPEAFYEVVRRVTAGRRLDMFSRRAIAGFDSWGSEAP